MFKFIKSIFSKSESLVHYSGISGLTSLDPKHQGTGVKGEENRRGVPEIKTTYFYRENSAPEEIVTSQAKSKYAVKLEPHHKLYDIGTDPDKIVHSARQKSQDRPYNKGILSRDDIFQAVRDSGHHGLYNSQGNLPNVVAMFHPTKVHSEEVLKKESATPEESKESKLNASKAFEPKPVSEAGLDYLNKEELEKSKNVREQRKKVFGTQSSPPAGPKREKHMEHIKDFVNRRYGIDMKPSGGKINEKTGQRRSDNPVVGEDKPDWRSGSLESQSNPDAMSHELGHLEQLPEGVNLPEGQRLMDRQYADVQRKYGYMKQKVSQGEVQPMAHENPIRRRMGLPATRVSVPVKNENDPPRMSVDTNEVIGTRVKQGKKFVDLIRQSRNLSPENRERLNDIDEGILKWTSQGWRQSDSPDAKINLRNKLRNQGASAEEAQSQVLGADIQEPKSFEEPKKLAASELEKSRPTIRFKNLKMVDSRPDQNVQVIETGKQKELFGRKVGNERVRDVESEKNKVIYDKKPSHDSISTTVAGKFDRNTYGVNYSLKNRSVSGALAGKARSKYEDGGEEHANKLQEHKEKRSQVVKDYNTQYTDWQKKSYDLSTKDLNDPANKQAWEEHRKLRPEKLTLPRKPAKKAVSTKDLSPDKMAARGREVESTVEHEAFHNLMDQVGRRYGHEAADILQEKLLASHDSNALKEVGNFIADTRGYGRASQSFNEETLAHARDLLVNPQKRADFKKYLNKKHGEAHQSLYDTHMKNLKSGHQKAYEMSQKVTPEELRGLKVLAASEKPFHGYNEKKHAKTGGLNDSYRKKINSEEGSNLKRPVTGKVKAGSEAAGRRKSFCARMSGVKGPTSKEGKLTPKGAALKRWKC